MKNLYKVKLERTTYQGQKSIEETELFAASKKDINTYRLGGFQRDSIKILSAHKIRARNVIEIDGDIKRNELSFSVSAEAHLDSTLSFNKKLTDTIGDDEQALLDMGYVERSGDNTYNYSSDFDNDIMFKIFDVNEKTDYLYSETAIVMAYIHTGLDARAGYKFVGIYNTGKWDGLCNFLDFHVRLTTYEIDTNNDVDDFDGDGAAYHLLKEYTLKSFDVKTGKIIVSKNGQDYNLSYYHPAEGV